LAKKIKLGKEEQFRIHTLTQSMTIVFKINFFKENANSAIFNTEILFGEKRENILGQLVWSIGFLKLTDKKGYSINWKSD
jgi:hypothetical protein